MIMASGARLCARSTGNWGSRARLDSLWHGTRVRLYTSTIPAVQTAGRGGCPLAGRMAFAGRPPGTGCTRTVGHLDCRIIRTRAFGSAPEGTGAGTLALSGTVHTFVQGLDVIDRKLLARCLNLQRELVEQLASTGRAPDAALPALQEEALLDSLLAINEVDAFVLACRFLTSMESPTEAILERVAGDAASYSSRMGGRVLKLCALGTPVERPVRVALEQLKAWLGRHREQQRWRALAAVVLDKLSALVMLTRINPEAPESIRRQAVQARGLVPWLLQQEALRLNSAQHAGADYLVRRALDALVELGGWGAEARLGAWYHDWLALGSVYKHQAEPPLPDAGSLAFRDWLPSSYGGQLPRLEEVLAAGPESSGKPEDRPPGRVSAVHQWLARWRPDTRPAAGKNAVLIIGGLFWHGGQGLPSSVMPAVESILSAKANLDEDTRQQATRLLQWAFCHCLLETVHRQGSDLMCQVPYASAREKDCAVSGLELVSSQEQLTRRLLLSPEGMQLLPVLVMQEAPVQAVLGKPDVLVVDSLSLLMLAQQFLDSVDRKLFWRALQALLGKNL